MTKKPKQRTFIGDSSPAIIEKALAAFQTPYVSWDLVPTSVELCDDFARVWFEYDPEYGDDADNKWEFSLCVPLYHFWGRKKREQYLKEQRKQRD